MTEKPDTPPILYLEEGGTYLPDALRATDTPGLAAASDEEILSAVRRMLAKGALRLGTRHSTKQ